MLLLLTEYLSRYFHVFHVFQYLTFRAILGSLTALFISLLVGPIMIRQLSKYQVGQSVRDDGPQSHLKKSGTPTMGGALILVAIALTTLLWGDLNNRYIWIVLFVTMSFGAIGWVDDYRKIVQKNSKGLPARWKYLWQSIFALITVVYLYRTAQLPVETQLLIPFFKMMMYGCHFKYSFTS